MAARLAGPPGSPVYTHSTNNKGKKGNHTSKEGSDLYNTETGSSKIKLKKINKIHSGTSTAKALIFLRVFEMS